jgi:hypothetical protein
MVDPTKITTEEQALCIEKNGTHVIKSLIFAKKKLEEYYHGGGEMNGMSYNAMLKTYNMINDALEAFTSINDRISKNVNTKKSTISSIPRRAIRNTETE